MLMANQTFFLIQKSNVKTLSNFSLFNIILIPNGDFQKSRRKFLHNTKKNVHWSERMRRESKKLFTDIDPHYCYFWPTLKLEKSLMHSHGGRWENSERFFCKKSSLPTESERAKHMFVCVGMFLRANTHTLCYIRGTIGIKEMRKNVGINPKKCCWLFHCKFSSSLLIF